MMMNRRTAYILMIVFAILAIVFCVMTWQASLQTGIGAGGWSTTATFGAEQFHIQLTAVAGGQ